MKNPTTGVGTAVISDMNINAFWNDIIKQNKASLPKYFRKDAIIRWHCTNEQFTVDEYIRANCEYPGNWCGEIERIEKTDKTTVLVGKVYPQDKSESFHVVSFIKFDGELISEMDEYWSDDGNAPEWRKKMNIGKPIKQ